MTNLTKEQIEQAKAARESSQAETEPTTTRKTRSQSTDLAVNEQTVATTALSVTASQTAGSQLAVAEGKAFVVGYAQTSRRIAAAMENELDKYRKQRQAAIASVEIPEEAEESDFLLEFESDLSAALAGI